jgi:hypothetical protein
MASSVALSAHRITADLVTVFLSEHYKFWGAVPPNHNVWLGVHVLELIAHQREPKVADAQAALTIHKDTCGLKFAVENVGGVEIFEPTH